MFKKIILAYDGSESAKQALETAAELARLFDSTMTVVHAYEYVSSWLGNPDYESQIKAQIKWSEEVLAQAMNHLDELALSSVEQTILEGPPATAIINAARVRDADLIVMGSRGMTPFKGLLVGSVSERVLGGAPCPVLIVR